MVSDIIDKLSPNIAPPTTVPIANIAKYQLPEKIQILQVQVLIVPTEVPIEIETNIQIINNPTIIKFCGMSDSPKLTVDVTPPIFSVVENAPAKIKMKTIRTIFECPAP